MDKTDCEDRACGAYEQGGEGVGVEGKMRGEREGGRRGDYPSPPSAYIYMYIPPFSVVVTIVCHKEVL